ncbi:MAG: metallophosphoesterase, partial [Acidimicrobiia bacterium]
MALLKRSQGARPEGVNLFFASDIHGSDVCWRKFIAAARFYEADTLILGGDFTGKLVVPVVDQGGGRFQAHFLGKDHELVRDDLPEFNRRIADAGFYSVEMGPDRLSELESDPEGITSIFEELMTSRLIEWIALARERLAGTGVRVLTAPANDDPYFIDGVIASHGGDVFVNVEDQVVELAPGHEMISSGYTNRTPWDTPREFDEDEIKA